MIYFFPQNIPPGGLTKTLVTGGVPIFACFVPPVETYRGRGPINIFVYEDTVNRFGSLLSFVQIHMYIQRGSHQPYIGGVGSG